MSALEITSFVSDEQISEVASWMHRTLRDEPALSPRSMTQLLRMLRSHSVRLVTDGDRYVGWVILIRHTRSVQELAGAYLAPRWRANGAVRKVLNELLSECPTTFCTTGSDWLADHLRRTWGFRPSSVYGLVLLTHGRIILDRLSPRRLLYGKSYLRPIRLQILRRDSLVQVTCPCCRTETTDVHSAVERAFGTNAKCHYAECAECEHVWMVDGPAASALSEPQSRFAAQVMDHDVVAALVYAPRLRWLQRTLSIDEKTRILDVGCGTGGFLRLAQSRTGAQCIGVEADGGLVSPTPQTPIVIGDFEKISIDQRFDLVTMFHVLEHFDDPLRGLRQAYKLIDPGGYLCMEIPRSDCLPRRIFRTFWFPLLPNFHRHIFSVRSLRIGIDESLPGGSIIAIASVYLPGEYVASANLPFTAWTPHPYQTRHRGLLARSLGILLALTVSVVALPMELVSCCFHRVIPTSGHVRVLIRKDAV